MKQKAINIIYILAILILGSIAIIALTTSGISEIITAITK